MGAARHGGNDRAAARACSRQLGGAKRKTRKLKIAEAHEAADRRRSRPSCVNEDEIRAAGDRTTPSRTASSSSTRSTRSPRAREAQRRRRVAPGRAARPAAAGRRHDRAAPSTAWSRPTTSCSSPVGRVPPEQAERPDPRTAGALPDPRRAAVAVGATTSRRILTQHARQPGQAVPGAARHRRRDARVHARRRSRRLAQIAFDVNERTENIGARRLATVMERLLDEVSFDAPNRWRARRCSIDAAVRRRARSANWRSNEDLSRYIL